MEPSPVTPFLNATAASNIAYAVSYTLPPTAEDNGFPWQVARFTYGGAGAGDCDADGDIDLFITYGDGSNRPNRLYLNQLSEGNPLQFLDDAANAGVAYSRSDGEGNDRHSSPVFADMDGDGDLDLFLGGLFGDPHKVYANRGDCSFDDVTTGSGLDALVVDHTISAAFGDYDLDGYLDLFLAHWGADDEYPPDGESEHLFRNISGNGQIRFTNVSLGSGVTESLIAARQVVEDFDTIPVNIDYTLTPTFARIDDDIWPDIAIVGDFFTTQLLLNEGPVQPGHFYDGSSEPVRSVQFGMGSALGDVDNDGDLDWFVTSVNALGTWNNILPNGNRLLENSGNEFVTSPLQGSVAAGGWGWGACFLDVDNDGHLDIYHTNGWPVEWAGTDFSSDRSQLFVMSDSGDFLDRAGLMGVNDATSGRGVVCADFDQDGDTDILQLTNSLPNSATLWENVSAAASNNFLRVRLVGLSPNTDAAGARIFATVGNQTQMREITIGSNFTSQNPTVQVFGLGTATSVDELRVEWPGLMPGPQAPVWSRTNVPAGVTGQTLVICHPDLMPQPADCTSSD